MRLAHLRVTAVVAAAAIAVAALGTGAPSAAPVAAAVSTAVTDWSTISARTVAVGRPGGSSAYLHAITIVAIHDAVAAIDGGARPLVSSPPIQLPADTDAAVAAAAHDVLIARVPGQLSQVQAAYDADIAGIPDGAARANGIAVGQAVAADVLAERADDGFDSDPDWIQPTPRPGVFEPVAPSKPVDIKMAAVKPLVLPVGDDGTVDDRFLPGPPIPLTGEEYAADFNEVKALGRKDGSARTVEQTETALFWAESPVIQWTRTFGDLALAKGLDRVETARLFAMTFVASADSLIVCLKAKYRYVFWRPVHAIQRADTDGNPATEPDAEWQSLLVINHPEYPSGHACGTGAIGRGAPGVLRYGQDRGHDVEHRHEDDSDVPRLQGDRTGRVRGPHLWRAPLPVFDGRRLQHGQARRPLRLGECLRRVKLHPLPRPRMRRSRATVLCDAGHRRITSLDPRSAIGQ